MFYFRGGVLVFKKKIRKKRKEKKRKEKKKVTGICPPVTDCFSA
jgi:hypothetical protein